MTRLRFPGAALLAAAIVCPTARADDSFAAISGEINKKAVKLFGSGGIKGLASYGTGILVSADGYILTVNSHLLDTQDLRVHLWDGTRWHAEVVATEAALDLALVKIAGKEKVDDLPFYDSAEAAGRPLATTGKGVLALSNMYLIGTRDEPMSVQHGVITSYARLYGKIGVHDATFTGHVYIVDAITNNPGAAGGPLTTRKGELLGLIGKELRNELTNTWINYAMPIGAKTKVHLAADDKEIEVSALDLLELKKDYNKKIKSIDPTKKKAGKGGYLGVVLMPNVVERTPPYVDDVLPGTPAYKAGFKPDDLIVYVDGLPAPSIDIYTELMASYGPGDKPRIEVRRGDKLLTIPVTLDKEPKKETPK
jgi:S1-C subfamily serine protease